MTTFTTVNKCKNNLNPQEQTVTPQVTSHCGPAWLYLNLSKKNTAQALSKSATSKYSSTKAGRHDLMVSTPDRSTRGAQIERMLKTVVFSWKLQRCTAWATGYTPLLHCLGPLSLLLCGTVKWQMAEGACLPTSAYQRTQMSSLQLGLQVGSHLALTDFHLDDLRELSCIDLHHIWLH